MINESMQAYLFFNVLEWTGANNREAHKEHIGLWIWQRSQTIIILLTYNI